ncbi:MULTISPECIES: DUF3850 domain-containing protein [Bacillus]|uniref:DUF3850 domain-containing protein n=1 Tax=Bacillus TaxID=1386 RepID=UPI000CDDEC60|nr:MULTISPECIES: DUF3850 domain-containing protein [Bacillus]AXC53654.1 DUF3850 domain-containing protein [Bacillus spizizenii]MCK8098933.1 DUF3850 domain-containing protein [Bacillus sp. 2CMS4F]MDN0189901.1 DUF3850 domain-containing protein [Bacillus sp. B.PNR1]MDN3034053.1 DUF3850 domain-containing protein [Bacillus sp. B.PNR2]POX32256.1 RNA-binding protein [Bacillus sp. Ru63]
MHHNLKINKEYFNPVIKEIKTFEIRKNDRNFQLGDKITLKEWDAKTKQYTGRKVNIVITYLTDFEQKDNYVVFSFKIL